MIQLCINNCVGTIGEISTPNLRGTVGNLFTLSLVTGVLLTSILAWLPWRLITGILIIPPLLFFVAMYFVPESPYFLMKTNRIVDAQRSLEWLRGSHFTTHLPKWLNFRLEFVIYNRKNQLSNWQILDILGLTNPFWSELSKWYFSSSQASVSSNYSQ